MSIKASIKFTVLGAAAMLIATTTMATFQSADAGPVVRNRVKGAIAGAAVGAIVGDPAAGAQIGRAIGTVKGISERRDRRRANMKRRR